MLFSMSRVLRFDTSLFGCLVVLALAIMAQAHAADRPPNIIFIMADDLGYAELGCYGQEKIKTPHIDSIAAEGIRFTQFYSGSAVCAPARCVLMTGMHTGHAHIKADMVLFQPAHHAISSGQAKGAAAGEQDRVDFFDQVHRPQEVGFAGAGRAAALVHPADGPGRGQNDSTAGRCFKILRVADLHTGDEVH